MAKKKASPSAKKSAPKTSPPPKAPVNKATPKVAAPKKAAVKKAAPAKKAAKASAGGGSVDGVIKKYEKERTTQESQLTALTKKIAGLEKQAQSLLQQIEKLTVQRLVAQESIAQLDMRRDEEIATLLAKLGVSVGGITTIAVTEITEVIVEEDDEDDSELDSDMEDSSVEEDEQKDDDLDSLLGGL
jgi:chromosome segregation ATPase